MANVTDPRGVSFFNSKLRTAADKLAQAYFYAKIVEREYYAENLGAIYSADLTGKIEDGAFNGDGRKVCDANMALNMINRCSEFIADYEAGGYAKLNTVLSVSVNPQQLG